MGRPRKELNVTTEEKEKLTLLARRPQSAQAMARRAHIVLSCGEGASNSEVAQQLGITGATVCKWRERFRVHRLDGLLDEPRVGAPRQITDEKIEEVITKTLKSMPAQGTHWSTRLMAEKSGLGDNMIGGEPEHFAFDVKSATHGFACRLINLKSHYRRLFMINGAVSFQSTPEALRSSNRDITAVAMRQKKPLKLALMGAVPSLFRVPRQTRATKGNLNVHTSYVEYDKNKIVNIQMALFGSRFVCAFIYAVAAGAVEMWKSRSDFQELWGRVENRFLVFQAFHNSSFPLLFLH